MEDSNVSVTENSGSRTFRVCGNSDNELLGPLSGRGLVVGYIEHVNGSEAQEVDGFIPTRHELIQLVKYWHRLHLDNQYFYFLYAQTGSRELREDAFARRRIDRIATLVGSENVDKAIAEVEEEFSKTKNPEEWKIFLRGDKAEWQAFQDRVQAELEAHVSKSRQRDR